MKRAAGDLDKDEDACDDNEDEPIPELKEFGKRTLTYRTVMRVMIMIPGKTVEEQHQAEAGLLIRFLARTVDGKYRIAMHVPTIFNHLKQTVFSPEPPIVMKGKKPHFLVQNHPVLDEEDPTFDTVYWVHAQRADNASIVSLLACRPSECGYMLRISKRDLAEIRIKSFRQINVAKDYEKYNDWIWKYASEHFETMNLNRILPFPTPPPSQQTSRAERWQWAKMVGFSIYVAEDFSVSYTMSRVTARGTSLCNHKMKPFLLNLFTVRPGDEHSTCRFAFNSSLAPFLDFQLPAWLSRKSLTFYTRIQAAKERRNSKAVVLREPCSTHTITGTWENAFNMQFVRSSVTSASSVAGFWRAVFVSDAVLNDPDSAWGKIAKKEKLSLSGVSHGPTGVALVSAKGSELKTNTGSMQYVLIAPDPDHDPERGPAPNRVIASVHTKLNAPGAFTLCETRDQPPADMREDLTYHYLTRTANGEFLPLPLSFADAFTHRLDGVILDGTSQWTDEELLHGLSLGKRVRFACTIETKAAAEELVMRAGEMTTINESI